MPLPDEWVERLLVRFQEIYGARITEMIADPFFKSLYKTILGNALNGLKNEEIKRGLYICNMRNQEPIPSPIHFWHLCKAIPYNIKKKERK